MITLDNAPRIVITEEDLDFLEAVRGHLPGGRFSCNREDIWPTDCWGNTSETLRRYLDDPPPVLCWARDQLAYRGGGRFRVLPGTRCVISCFDDGVLAILELDGDER